MRQKFNLLLAWMILVTLAGPLRPAHADTAAATREALRAHNPLFDEGYSYKRLWDSAKEEFRAQIEHKKPTPPGGGDTGLDPALRVLDAAFGRPSAGFIAGAAAAVRAVRGRDVTPQEEQGERERALADFTVAVDRYKPALEIGTATDQGLIWWLQILDYTLKVIRYDANKRLMVQRAEDPGASRLEREKLFIKAPAEIELCIAHNKLVVLLARAYADEDDATQTFGWAQNAEGAANFRGWLTTRASECTLPLGNFLKSQLPSQALGDRVLNLWGPDGLDLPPDGYDEATINTYFRGLVAKRNATDAERAEPDETDIAAAAAAVPLMSAWNRGMSLRFFRGLPLFKRLEKWANDGDLPLGDGDGEIRFRNAISAELDHFEEAIDGLRVWWGSVTSQ